MAGVSFISNDRRTTSISGMDGPCLSKPTLQLESFNRRTFYCDPTSKLTLPNLPVPDKDPLDSKPESSNPIISILKPVEGLARIGSIGCFLLATLYGIPFSFSNGYLLITGGAACGFFAIALIADRVIDVTKKQA